MSEPHVFTDVDGENLVIDSYPHHALGQVASFRTGGTIYIAAKDLPEVVAALYEACGQPEPILLDRIDIGRYVLPADQRPGAGWPCRPQPAPG